MRKALIRNLEAMQKWRRGEGDKMPLSPTEFGYYIDCCIQILKELNDKEVEKILRDERKD